MSNLFSSNSEIYDLNEVLSNTIPSSSLFCICCLEKEVPYISLLTCSHADFLNSLTVPEIKPRNKVVCYQCHDMLKKIKLFKLQVEDSFNLLTDQVISPKCSNQKHRNIKVHKILDINIPQTSSIENQQTILNKGMNKTIKKEKEILDEKESLTNKDKKVKNIEEALKIINNNQNNGCINLLATSLQSLSNTILTDKLKILNDFQLLGKTFTNSAERLRSNTTTSPNNTDTPISTNIKEDPQMSINETNDIIINESVNEIDIVKEGLHLPVTIKDEGVDDRMTQIDEPMIYEPQPTLSSNIEQVMLTREELMQERSDTAASHSFLRSAHRCESCVIGFHYEENLEDHVKRKHAQKEGTINCEVCLQSISPGPSYDEHVRRHYTRFKCLSCGQQFTSYDKATFHYKKKHSKPIIYRCQHCSYNTVQRFKLKYHLRNHSKCKECGVFCTSVKKIKKNMKLSHTSSSEKKRAKRTLKTYRCEHCEKNRTDEVKHSAELIKKEQ